jgi:hypothetical protein
MSFHVRRQCTVIINKLIKAYYHLIKSSKPDGKKKDHSTVIGPYEQQIIYSTSMSTVPSNAYFKILLCG